MLIPRFDLPMMAATSAKVVTAAGDFMISMICAMRLASAGSTAGAEFGLGGGEEFVGV